MLYIWLWLWLVMPCVFPCIACNAVVCGFHGLPCLVCCGSVAVAVALWLWFCGSVAVGYIVPDFWAGGMSLTTFPLKNALQFTLSHDRINVESIIYTYKNVVKTDENDGINRDHP